MTIDTQELLAAFVQPLPIGQTNCVLHSLYRLAWYQVNAIDNSDNIEVSLVTRLWSNWMKKKNSLRQALLVVQALNFKACSSKLVVQAKLSS